MNVFVYYVISQSREGVYRVERGCRSLALHVDIRWWAAHRPEVWLVLDPARYDLGNWEEIGRTFTERVSFPPRTWRTHTARQWLEVAGVVMPGNQPLWPMLDPVVEKRMWACLQGRCLRSEELQALWGAQGLELDLPALAAYVQSGYVQGHLQIHSGMKHRVTRNWLGQSKRRARCRRCGETAQLHTSPCAQCGRPSCTYCLGCLQMGRIRTCTLLVNCVGALHPPAAYISEGSTLMPDLSQWGLSEPQQAAALLGLAFLRRPVEQQASAAQGSKLEDKGERPTFLIWAVTGAGKTEMLFPFIADRLAHSGMIAIASPRRDVVIELEPRLKQAFPQVRTVVLHGASTQRWESGDLFLTTTHQLLRFYQAFDLVVIDEVDAFPYHNDEALQRAARQACKPSGKFVLLSATPPAALQRQIRLGRLAHAKVPVRFHGHPLPVPQLIIRRQARGRYAVLCERLRISLRRGAQIFVFVPRIAEVEPLVAKLQTYLSTRGESCDDEGRTVVIAGTSSKDEARADKVKAFRERGIRVLVTTTILERGVTIAKADVYIYDADNRLFDEAALVQMAGRAGRNKDDPAGRVAFFAADRTLAQMGAVRQIRSMNRLARKRGYLRS